MSTKVKTIVCLDGQKRRCERLLSDDGWGYLALTEYGTSLITIPDRRLAGSREVTEEEAGK